LDDNENNNENDNENGNLTERKGIRRVFISIKFINLFKTNFILKLPINVKNLTIKGTEISSKRILFSLRLVNFKNIQ
jgi:hypothetical protein